MTTYTGIAGVGPDAATLPAGSPRAGVFGYDRRTGLMGDIPDGLSNTLLLLESVRDTGPWAQGGPATVRGLDPADRPYLGSGRAFGGNHFPNKSWFNHDRDVPATAAMGDGSARVWYPSHISPEVLEALATVAGGDTATPD